MASVKSILIKGTRSFHPNPEDNSKATIDFDGPLTLIVGKNGSGKTSIIEALYYSITGENTKYSNLISDPQIWGENKTNAELKLEFVSTENKNVVVTRKPDAKIVKRSNGKLELKFSNNSGSISVNGKLETDQSTTQLNEKVLQHFGVRESILKYVIFCRQEDSCWPVELPNNDLIERFNQIFDTDRYERAKQNIDDLVKKIEEKINDNKEKENVMVLYKDQIDEINKLDNEIKEKEPHMIKQEFDEKSRQKHENNGLLKKLQSEEADIEAKCGQIHPPQEECNEELSKSNIAMASIDSQIKSYKESKEKEQENETILSLKEKEKEEQKEELKEKLEKCEKEKHIHDFNLNEFKESYNTDDYISKQNEVNYQISSMSQELNEKKQEQTNLESAYNNKKQEYEQEVNKTTNDQEHFIENINAHNKALKKYDGYSQDNIGILIKDYESSKANLDNFRNSEENPESIKRRMETCQSSIEEVQITIKQYEEQSRNLESISNLERKINDNESSKEEKLSKIRNALNNQTLTADDVSQQIEEMKKLAEEETNNSLGTKSRLESELDSITKEKNGMKKAVHSKNKEISRYEEIIKEIIIPQGSTPGEEIEKIQADIQKLQNKQAMYQKKKSIYQTFRKATAAKGCKCPLCQREFANIGERDDFVHNMLDAKIEKARKKYEDATKEIEELNGNLQKLESCNEYYQNYENLVNEVNSLKQKIDFYTKEQEQKQGELESVKRKLEESNNEKKFIENLVTESTLLKIYIDTIEKHKKEHRDFINQHNLHGLPSLDEVKELLKQSRQKYIEYNEEFTQLSKEHDKANKKDRDLEKAFNEAENKCEQYKAKLDEKNKIENELNELNDKVRKASEKRKIAEECIEKINEEFKPKITAIKSEVESLSNNLQSLKQDGQNIDKLVKTLLDAKKFLKENNQDSLETEFEKTKKEIAETKENLEECRSKLRNIEEKLKEGEIIRNEHANIIEKMSQHIKYYENHNKLLECQHNIDELDSTLFQIDQEKNKREEEYKQESIELNLNKGRLEATTKYLKDHVQKAEELIGQPGKLTEIRIIIAALNKSKEDLGIFKKAISDSLVEYHQTMIKKINKIINKLWRKTYSDKDVGTIKLNAVLRDGKYKYSVVMEKNGVEMSVKDRCSAGQKMLASLAIRIALSQVFANNCGVIALDEPTTNLDNKKAMKFANRLSKLVKKRKETGTGNFQMIIVSHSEEFCQQITDELNIDHYYEVEKKSDSKNRSYSQINIKDISQLKLNK